MLDLKGEGEERRGPVGAHHSDGEGFISRSLIVAGHARLYLPPPLPPIVGSKGYNLITGITDRAKKYSPPIQ